MKILLLGATGLVGRHIREQWATQDLVSSSHDGHEATVQVDLRELEALQNILREVRPDVIVNAAAVAWVEQCERDPIGTRKVNVVPTEVLARYAARNRSLLVVFSSEYVFDGRLGPYSEDAPPAPINEYGRQKREVEEIAASIATHLIVRTSGVYGAEAARKNFVLQVVDHLRAGKPFRVATDQLVTPTYAPSLAEAIAALVARGDTGLFHVPGPEVLSRERFAGMVVSAFDLPSHLLAPVPTSELGLSAARPASAGLSDAKLRSTLGHPTTSPEQGLRALAAMETR